MFLGIEYGTYVVAMGLFLALIIGVVGESWILNLEAKRNGEAKRK